MSTLAINTDTRVKDVCIDSESLTVSLMDGRVISTPLAWYPRLMGATKQERQQWEICGGGYGLHWEALDEDLSIDGMLAGNSAH